VSAYADAAGTAGATTADAYDCYGAAGSSPAALIRKRRAALEACRVQAAAGMYRQLRLVSELLATLEAMVDDVHAFLSSELAGRQQRQCQVRGGVVWEGGWPLGALAVNTQALALLGRGWAALVAKSLVVEVRRGQ
jgi:hypothetical protein